MNDTPDFNSLNSRFVPIPPIFQSLEKDGPFEHCLRCERSLLDSSEPYMIERVFKLREPIIEYAMCMSCVGESQQELSQESRDAVTRYFLENLDRERRAETLMRLADSDDVTEWIDECVLTGTPAADCRERQIMALCEGDQMRLDIGFPMMLSGLAVEGIVEVLSEQTRGWMEDFVGDNFGMPPEFVDTPDFMPVLF